jgi:glycosyltransferase involved in cell wall biosynthesis
MNRLGAVVIGRNEAKKLPRCLSSVLGFPTPIIFVDSGSDDGSADLARTMGVDVVELDRSTPFSVARARNTGFARALHLDPEVEFIQFIDADSEVIHSWFALARNALVENPDVAVVYGRVRERDPHRSPYARLYQAEFEVQFSEPDVCGGMAMMRVAAVRQVHGFNSAMVGFEDFELSFRLRRVGWRVLRLDADMAVHEAAMNRPAQWCQRQIRGGYARAQEVALHGRSPQRYGVRECISIWFWGLLLPVLAVTPAGPTHGVSLVLLAAYPALSLRIYRRMRRRGLAAVGAALYAASCVLDKFPQVVGLARFHVKSLGRWLHLRPRQHVS